MYKTRNGAKYYIKRTNDFSPRDSMTGEQVVDIDWQESGFGRMVGGDYSGFWVSMADVTEIVEPPPTGIYTTHVIDVYNDGTISIDNGEPF